MNDCPVVGGRKYDVECDGVRWGPIRVKLRLGLLSL